MKSKVLALCLIVALALCGCQTVKSWFCSNEAVINNIITRGNNTITSIESMFPDVVPEPWKSALDAARALVAQGEKYLAAGCPTDAQVQTLESSQAQVTSSLKAAGAKTLKALKAKP